MNVTKELDVWIEQHGSARDALNVALAHLHAVYELSERWKGHADDIANSAEGEESATEYANGLSFCAESLKSALDIIEPKTLGEEITMTKQGGENGNTDI